MNKLLFLFAFLAFLLFFRAYQLVSDGFNDLAFVQLNRIADTKIWESVSRSETDLVVKFLETAVTIWPNNYSAWRALGYTRINSDNPKNGIDTWKNADSMAEELVAWGKIEEKKGNNTTAFTLNDWAIQLNPELADPWFFKGIIYEKDGNDELAAMQYQAGLQRSVFKEVGRSDLYFHLGKMVASNSETAIDLYDRAIEVNDFRQPKAELQTRYSRGVALRWSGREEESMSDFAWVLAHKPDHYWALVHQGALQWQLEQDAEGAEELMLQATAVKPELTWAYLNLGQFYEETGQNEKAVEMYRQVIRLNVNDETAQNSLRRLQGANEN